MSYFHFSGAGPQKKPDGIRLQSSRGGVGSTWWGQRWVAALEKLCDSGRLSRGKSYARQGQVLSIEIFPGRVLAKVQGTRPKPYTVSVELAVLSPKAWKKVQATLSDSPLHLARLLAGDMSAEMELNLNKAGISLFPAKRSDLETDCSCPDWSDPCKHIAAVYYLLAEQFDADPFLLFRLRGLDRADLLASLGADPASQAGSQPNQTAQAQQTPQTNQAGQKELPLSTELGAFWHGNPLPPLEPAQPPVLAAPLLKRLKSPPFWRGEMLFAATLEPVYLQAAAVALSHLEGPAEREASQKPEPGQKRSKRKRQSG